MFNTRKNRKEAFGFCVEGIWIWIVLTFVGEKCDSQFLSVNGWMNSGELSALISGILSSLQTYTSDQ